MGSSVWAAGAYFLYRKEKNARTRLAFFSLTAGLDRLQDTLSLLAEELQPLADGMLPMEPHDRESVGHLELRLLRNVDAIQVEWLVSNLPHETDGLVWMYDVSYIVSNARELVNQLATVGLAWKRNGAPPRADCTQMLAECQDLLKGIDGEKALIPRGSNALAT